MARFAGLTLAALVFDRFFALALTVAVSASFGTRTELDAYLLAVAGPMLIATIAGDLFYTLLLPALVDADLRGDVALGWDVVIWAGACVAAIAVGYAAIWAIAVPADPGHSSSKLLALGLAASPMIFFGGVAVAAATALVAQHRYIAATLRIPLTSLAALIAFGLISRFNVSALALMLSMLAGSIAGATVTVAVLLRTRGRPRLRLSRARAASVFRPLAKATAGQLIAGLVSQAPVPIERIIGFGLGAGVISALNYGRVLVSPPLLVGQSIATAAYPRFVDESRTGDAARYQTLGRTIAMVIFLLLPLSALAALLAGPLVQVVYHRGAFDEHAVTRTTVAATVLAASLIPTAVGTVLTRFLYAQRASGVVAAATLATLVLYILFAAALGSDLGLPGLAVASLLAYLALAVLLLAVVGKSSPTGLAFLPYRRLLKMAGASFAAGVAIYLVVSRGPASHGSRAFGIVVIASLLGGAVYLVAAYLLRIPELWEAISTGRRAFSRGTG